MPLGGGGGGSTGGSTTNVVGQPSAVNINQQIASNKLLISSFSVNSTTVFSHIVLRIKTADAVNSYDAGIYTSAGVLLANIGAQTLPSTGNITFSILQSAQTLTPGIYALGLTGAVGAVAGFDGSNVTITWLYNQTYANSSSSTCPSSITALTVGVSNNAICFLLY